MLDDVIVAYSPDGFTGYAYGGRSSRGFNMNMFEIDMATGARRWIRGFGKIPFLAQGFVENSSWSWTPGKLLYLQNNGSMTQTRPTSGVATVVGIAYTATKICLNPRPPKVI